MLSSSQAARWLHGQVVALEPKRGPGLRAQLRLYGLLGLLVPVFAGLQTIVHEGVPRVEIRVVSQDAPAPAVVTVPVDRVVERIVYVPVEGPRGEQGFTVISDGTNRPWRVKSRSPSLLACQALERMIVGNQIADVIAVIGSIDVVMGDVDR